MIKSIPGEVVAAIMVAIEMVLGERIENFSIQVRPIGAHEDLPSHYGVLGRDLLHLQRYGKF